MKSPKPQIGDKIRYGYENQWMEVIAVAVDGRVFVDYYCQVDSVTVRTSHGRCHEPESVQRLLDREVWSLY